MRARGVIGAMRFPAFALGVVCPVLAGPLLAPQPVAHTDPNSECAPCHREIYDRYRKTPMANASGPAPEGFIAADFRHPASGVHYRVFEEKGDIWLSYKRDGQLQAAGPGAPSRPLAGQVQLRYFLGSGKRGRTYLFERQGYWFEAPINWYAKKQMWDMTPNYLNAQEMPLTLPVDPGCLHCHASGAASSLPDARNHYAGPPFTAGGVTCAACHGDGSAHAASGGKVSMMKIDKLDPVKRDSVCLSCHLEGQAAVTREGKRLESFIPGDSLFDYAVFFVHRTENGSGRRATSQWEALLKSRCKQNSGDRMTCTTCHDPHGSPSPEQRISFYRQKCLQCHSQPEFATRHHPEKQDCTMCHMGRPQSNDIAHEQVTDHWIRKHPSEDRLLAAQSGDLVAVGGVAASDRDLGLAYAQFAARGDVEAGKRALELLREAERVTGGAANDHEVHAQLGFLEQLSGQAEQAEAEYRLALAEDPYDSLAGGNLALIVAQQHHYLEAAKLWKTAFEHDPVQLRAGLNLATVQCGLGERKAALDTLERVLAFAPDNERAHGLLAAIQGGELHCPAR